MSARSYLALGRALIGLSLMALAAPGLAAQQPELVSPEVLLPHVPFSVTVTAEGADGQTAVVYDAAGEALGSAMLVDGVAVVGDLTIDGRSSLPLRVELAGSNLPLDRPVMPGWMTLLPPFLAILLALVVREVVVSLFAGLWLGCFFLLGYDPFGAVLLTVGRFGRDAVIDSDHASIIIFSLLLGGMVGVLARMGATTSIVEAVRPIATTPLRGQLATWVAGLMIFFDDYSNTLIVGNTMRPVTDRLKVSREKLAYIVDSTAAPVSAMVFVSTWVGFEISLIADGLAISEAQGGAPATVSAFAVFISSIPYLFYPILALSMVFLLVVMGRDFGPMLKAEQRARAGGGVIRPGAQLGSDTNELTAPDGVTSPWWSAVLPIVVVVITVLVGLIATGRATLPPDQRGNISAVFGASDPFTPLLWGSLLGSVAAMALAVGLRKLRLQSAVEAWLVGSKGMLLALVTLVLAWSLGEVTEVLGTAQFLASVLSERLAVSMLPLAVFVISGSVAFATGSSWGTMAILFPLAVPLVVTMGGVADPAAGHGYSLVLATVAAVMGGALFGDHCSPISDTTILSSMASGCDHVDHVRTQLPYALTAAAVAGIIGIMPAGLGAPPWVSLIAGLLVIAALVRFLGKPSEV